MGNSSKENPLQKTDNKSKNGDERHGDTHPTLE